MKSKITPLILLAIVLLSSCKTYTFLDIKYSKSKTTNKIRPLNIKSNTNSYSEIGYLLIYNHEMRNNVCQLASIDSTTLDKQNMGASDLRITKSKNGKNPLLMLACLPTALACRIPGIIGLPWGHAKGIVKLEVDVKDGNGTLIKTYKAKGKHSSLMACYWGYKKRDDAKDASKDKAFAKAMSKIKKQMDSDAEFLNSKLPIGVLTPEEQKANKFIADGNKNFDNKNYDMAIQNYEEAVKLLNPLKKQHAKFLYQLGTSHQNMLTDEGTLASIKYFSKSIEVDPYHDLMVPASLYYAYLDVNDFKNAKKSLDIITTNYTLNTKQSDLIKEWRNKLAIDEEQITAGLALKEKPEKVTINNLGADINCKEGDYFPSVTADESMLLFTSRRPGSTGGLNSSGEYDEDLWYSLKQADGSWSTAKNFGAPVNIKNNNGIASFTGDGQYVVCARCNEPDGVGSCDLYGTTLLGNTWNEPKNLGKIINSKEWDSQVSISADGKTLVWSSTREGGYGEEDIWISRKDTSGEWTTPKNLGAPVNTKGTEISPYLHPDGKTLYFSSNSISPRIGGYDVYKTTIQADGTCTKPVNLGYPINTEKNDRYYVQTPSGLKAYFVSDRAGGQGSNDIYEIIYPQEMRSKLTTFIGIVYDEETKIPLEANIKIEDLDSAKLVGEYVSNSATGKCVVILTPGHNYSLTVSKNGYLFYSENFNIGVDNEFKEVKKDIPLQAIKEGKKIVLNNIFFQTGKAELTETSMIEINNLFNLMVQNPDIKVEISGHTDNVGSASANKTLSQERAAVVVKALVAKGTSASRLTAKGYGDSAPVAPNDTDENRQLNRRTEFKIISKTK